MLTTQKNTAIKLNGGYRYGFNGMESDDEVKGNNNSYDFGARIYDSRVGRWLSGDSKFRFYPDLAPYVFVANNPLLFIDPDGNVIVDPKTKRPVVKMDGEWVQVKEDALGERTYLPVSKKFVEQTKPVLDVMEKSEVGASNIAYMQSIPTLVTIDPSAPDNLPGDASSVIPTDEDMIDGYYKAVTIVPDFTVMQSNIEGTNISMEEKLTGVMAVEVGHLNPQQIKIDQDENSTFASQYNKLLNNHLRAQISYRKANGIKIDDGLFAPLDKFASQGFVLDNDLQMERDMANNPLEKLPVPEVSPIKNTPIVDHIPLPAGTN